jgi:AcrR family transcriptional regulator
VRSDAGGVAAARARALRADARRNRERILSAARDVFVEQGADAPLDEVARRAGVGIATLYRRFPDRPTLLRQLALEVMGRSAGEARAARAEEPDAFGALARYLHRAVDLRFGAVMPVIVGRLTMDEELRAARRESVEQLNRIVAAAHGDGSLRPDVAPGDIGLLLVRLTRPLPGRFPRDVDRDLAHRHLDLILDGLRAAGSALPGPALTFEDLAAVDPPSRPVTSSGGAGRAAPARSRRSTPAT